MDIQELKGKMVVICETPYSKETVMYLSHIDDKEIHCIDWNGNTARIGKEAGSNLLREATPQEVFDAVKHDCELNAQEYDYC